MTDKEAKQIIDEEIDIAIADLAYMTDDLFQALKVASRALELQPCEDDVIGKIRTEIEKLEYLNIYDGSGGYDKYIEQYEVLKIIDEYNAESGDEAW